MSNSIEVLPKKKSMMELFSIDDMAIIEIAGSEDDDQLFPDESLERLRNMNQEYGVVLLAKGFKIFRNWINPATGIREISFMKKTDFNHYFANQFLSMQIKGRNVQIPLSKAWLKWRGKRVFTLQKAELKPSCEQ